MAIGGALLFAAACGVAWEVNKEAERYQVAQLSCENYGGVYVETSGTVYNCYSAENQHLAMWFESVIDDAVADMKRMKRIQEKLK